jgi:hypothetical protein
VTTSSLSIYSETSINRECSWHFILHRFKHTNCYDTDIMFPFFCATLDLVLPATRKRITDLCTEIWVANSVHYHKRSINQRSNLHTSVLIEIQGSEKGWGRRKFLTFIENSAIKLHSSTRRYFYFLCRTCSDKSVSLINYTYVRMIFTVGNSIINKNQTIKQVMNHSAYLYI